MKTQRLLGSLLMASLTITLNGCTGAAKNAPENASAGQIPATMQCPGRADASQGCPSPSDPVVALGEQAPSGAGTGGDSSSELKTKLRAIEGRCELRVQGESKPRTCENIKLQVRSKEAGEMRDGEVNGFAVRFADLSRMSYTLIASSPDYKLTTSGDELNPGQRVLLKIQAQPIAK